MVAIFDEILFVDQEVMVRIKLPKLAVYNVKVFIREEPEIRSEKTDNISSIHHGA